MKIDLRSLILALWITLGVGMLTTTLTFQQYDGAPTTLAEARLILLGMWIAGGLAGLIAVLWDQKTPPLILMGSAALGYASGTLIRLMFLKMFLPGAEGGFSLFWDMLLLRGLPAYHSFLLLVLPGGLLITCLGAALGSQIALADLPPLPQVENRALLLAAGLPGMLVVAAILFGNLNNETAQARIVLDHLDWLTLPQLNMLLVTLVGFMVGLGGGQVCAESSGAALNAALGAMLHVSTMVLLTALNSFYGLVGGFDANRVGIPAFIFFWLVTPIMGAMAAFALHTLRESLFGAGPSNPKVQSDPNAPAGW